MVSSISLGKQIVEIIEEKIEDEVDKRVSQLEAKFERSPDSDSVQVPEFLTKKEAAKLLSCSPSTVDKLARNGKLTRHYIGKTVRFERSELLILKKEHFRTKK